MALDDHNHEWNNSNNDDAKWPRLEPWRKQQWRWTLQDQNHEKSSSNNSNGVKQSQPPKEISIILPSNHEWSNNYNINKQ